MNKRGIILLAAMITAGGAVFASGQQDEAADMSGRGRGAGVEEDQQGGRGRGPMMGDMEEVEMTGTVDITSNGVTMAVDGAEWILLLPPEAGEMEIESGTEVMVAGFELPTSGDEMEDRRGLRMDFEEGAQVFHVLAVTIDGETFEFSPGGGPGNGNGNGGGRRG